MLSTIFHFFCLCFQHWFKNYRARKLHKDMRSVYQTTLSNQFELVPEDRTIIWRRLQFVPERIDSDHWKHTTCVSRTEYLLHNCASFSTKPRVCNFFFSELVKKFHTSRAGIFLIHTALQYTIFEFSWLDWI